MSRTHSTSMLEQKSLLYRFSSWLQNCFNPHKEGLPCYLVLYLASILQFSVFSRLPIPGTLDLITIWTTLCVIAKPFRQGLIFAIVAGLVFETQTTLPVGQVLCVYILLASVVRVSRPSLSWRERKPWLVFILGANLALITTETFVLVSENQTARFHLSYFFGITLRIGFALAGAMMLPRSILYFQQPKEDSL